MAKKVVYSLLALSAVPAANANAAAVAAPAQGTQVQGEMTAADVQEVYQMLEASAEDFANVINGLQNQLNAGVNEIEDMLGQAEKFDERVDQEKLAALVQLLKDSKIDIATIDQGLDDIKNNEENQTEDNFAKVSAPAETNEYLIRLEEILKAARDAFNELNAENENILANDANQAAADELQNKLDELKDKEVADENKKGEIDDAIKNVEDQVNGFKEAADKAFEDGTATEFEPDPSKEEIEEAIQAVSDQIDAINANYDAYKEVKDAIDASTAAYNEAMDLLQTTLGGKEDYVGLLKDTQKLLTEVQQNIKLADKANEEAYAEGKSVEKKDELLGMFETDTDAILKIAQDAIAKYEAIEAAKEAVSTLQENLDKVEVKDEFLNKEELQTEKDDIQKEINDLSDAVKDAIAYPEVDGSYSVEEQAAAIQQKIDDLVGKVEEAQKAAKENQEAYDAVIASIGDLQQMLDEANEKVEEKTYENNDNASVKERYDKLDKSLQDQIDEFTKQAEEANANGTAVEFNENFPEASKDLKAAIEEYYRYPSAALDHYDEVWEQLGTVDESMKELNDFINGMTADNTEAKAQAEELAGRIDAVKGEIADALTKEGKEHWEAMLAVNAPDADGGPTELDEIAEAIDELMDQVKADQQAYDDEEAKNARIAVSNEVRDRLDAIYDLIEEIGGELNEENKDAIGSAYDELVKQFEEIQNVDLAAQEDSYKQNKEYEDGDPEGATPGADGERNDNLEPDDVKAHSELSKIVDALKGIAEDLNQLKDDIQNAKDKVADNNAAKTTADADVDALQEKLDQAIQTVADLVKDETGDPVETEFADDFEKIQGEIDDLQKEIDDAYAAEELADKLDEINDKIKGISDEIKQTVDDAKAFQANLDAIADLLDRYEEVKKEYEDAMATGVAEADKDGDATEFYVDQLEAQQTILDLIKEDIDKLTNDAVEKKPDLMDRLDKFEEGVNQVLQDAADNREAYENQKTAKEETQDLWNEVYTRINTTDESSIKDEWLEKLDKLQDDINKVALTISDSYKEGKSVENDDAIMDEITRIKNALNDLDAQQQEGYDEQIAKDNTAMYDAFLEAIANTDLAFKRAVETIDSYRNVKNEGLKKVVEDIVVKYHDLFYVLPTDATEEDPYRVKIQDLKDEVREAFAKVKSPEKFDEESTYVQRANDLTTEIEEKTKAFLDEIQAAIDVLWADIEADVTAKVDAAKAELTGAEPPYEVDADKAFETLTDKIAEAKEYAHDATEKNIQKLDEVLENYLVKADEIIADALNEAAKVGGGGVSGDGLRALVGGQVGGGDVVAVGDGRLVNASIASIPAGEGVGEHACVHAAGLHQRVGDGGGVSYGPTDEATAIIGAGSGGKGAVEHTAIDNDGVTTSGNSCHNSAMGAVAAHAAVDAHRTATARDVQRARRFTHDAACKFGAGGDGAIDVEVLDNGISGESEWCGTFCRCVIVDSQRVAVAQEGALERVGLVGSHHRRDADVAVHLHVLSAEGTASSDGIGEAVPVVRAADDEGIALDARALRGPCHRHGVGRTARAGRTPVAAVAAGSAVVDAIAPAIVIKIPIRIIYTHILSVVQLCVGAIASSGGSIAINARVASESAYFIVAIMK